MTEGLSARFPICCIEIRLSYPFRHFVTPPLTIRGGSLLCFPCAKRETISAPPLVQRGEVKEGLSARFPICCIEIRLSYPFRHFVPPPLTIRGGSLLCLPCAKRETISAAPLVQRGEVKGGLSARFSICFIEIRFSYPFRHFVPPPLTIRGGMIGGCDTSPYHKGRHDWWVRYLPFVKKGRHDKGDALTP